MIYCTECGAEVDKTQSYCQDCGTEVSHLASADQEAHVGPEAVGQQEGATAGRATLKQQLQTMDNYAFEHFVADLWEMMGWQTEVSQASLDAGIDVIAEKESPYHHRSSHRVSASNSSHRPSQTEGILSEGM